jgi:hypothetical protein
MPYIMEKLPRSGALLSKKERVKLPRSVILDKNDKEKIKLSIPGLALKDMKKCFQGNEK